MSNKKVLVLGASENPARYSYLAANRLLESGYNPILVSNREGAIRGIPFFTHWPAEKGVDTITLYLNPKNQEPYINSILESQPKRVIFNPGTENMDFYNRLVDNGIEAINACTLVMLSTGQF